MIACYTNFVQIFWANTNLVVPTLIKIENSKTYNINTIYIHMYTYIATMCFSLYSTIYTLYITLSIYTIQQLTTS